jgi:hypothetical protein
MSSSLKVTKGVIILATHLGKLGFSGPSANRRRQLLINILGGGVFDALSEIVGQR